MNPGKKRLAFLAVIFIGSILLRLGLATYNREANDPHMQVIRYIIKNGSLPEKANCGECFQPKLFHYTIAKILNLIGLNESRDADAQKIAAQLVNFAAGMAILFIAWAFARQLPGIHPVTKLLGFALLALNPQLIGINSQVTNDTFLILLCVLAVYYAYLTLTGDSVVYFLFTVVFSVLAVSTKTNGWVTVIAIALAFLGKNLFAPERRSRKMLLAAVIYPFLVAGLVVLNPLSQYVKNYSRYGTPVLINIEKQPRPLLFKETYTPYAGILSIQDGFLTFKFKDLMDNPTTAFTDIVDETTHRTSLWTRLYGSANSVHFENYPPSWRAAANPALFAITRGIFILALLPALAVLAGAIMEIYGTIKGILTKDTEMLERVSYGLFAFLFAGYILFSILYAFEYRIFMVMKAIFIYPGLLAFFVFFLKGASVIALYAKEKKWAVVGALWIAALSFLYVLDVSFLIFQLLPNRSGINIIMDSLMRARQ